MAAGHAGAPDVRVFLLCPQNLVVALQPEFERGVEPAQAAIVAYVEAHGRRVERLSLQPARQLWLRGVAAAKAAGERRFEAAALAFVKEAAALYEFDALLMPSLILRQVLVQDREAAWDGVERRIRFANTPRAPVGRGQNTFTQGIAMGSLSANVSVVSLHLFAFARDGRMVFQGRGGIDILEEVDFEGVQQTMRFQLRRRDDVFEDRQILDEAVEVAFTPYLAPLPR